MIPCSCRQVLSGHREKSRLHVSWPTDEAVQLSSSWDPLTYDLPWMLLSGVEIYFIALQLFSGSPQIHVVDPIHQRSTLIHTIKKKTVSLNPTPQHRHTPSSDSSASMAWLVTHIRSCKTAGPITKRYTTTYDTGNAGCIAVALQMFHPQIIFLHILPSTSGTMQLLFPYSSLVLSWLFLELYFYSSHRERAALEQWNNPTQV